MLSRWIKHQTFLNVSLNRLILENQVKTLFTNRLHQQIITARDDSSESVFNGDMVKRKPPYGDLTNQHLSKMAKVQIMKDCLCSGDAVIHAKTDGEKNETGAASHLLPIGNVSTSSYPPDTVFSCTSNTSTASDAHARNYGIHPFTNSLAIRDSRNEGSSTSLSISSDIVSPVFVNSSSFQPLLPQKDSGDIVGRRQEQLNVQHPETNVSKNIPTENKQPDKNNQNCTRVKKVVAKSEVKHKVKTTPVGRTYPVSTSATRKQVSMDVKQASKVTGTTEKHLENEKSVLLKRKAEISENTRGIRNKLAYNTVSKPSEVLQTRSRGAKHTECNKETSKIYESAMLGPEMKKTKTSSYSFQKVNSRHKDSIINNGVMGKELGSSSKSPKSIEGRDAGIRIPLEHVKHDKVFHGKLPSAAKNKLYLSQPLVKQKVITNKMATDTGYVPIESSQSSIASRQMASTLSKSKSFASSKTSAGSVSKHERTSDLCASNISPGFAKSETDSTVKPCGVTTSDISSAATSEFVPVITDTLKHSSTTTSGAVTVFTNTSKCSSASNPGAVTVTTGNSKCSASTKPGTVGTSKRKAAFTPGRLITPKEIAVTKPNEVNTSKGKAFSKSGGLASLKPSAVPSSKDKTSTTSKNSDINTLKSTKAGAVDGKKSADFVSQTKSDKFRSSKVKPASLNDSCNSKYGAVTHSEMTSKQRVISASNTTSMSSTSSKPRSSCSAKPKVSLSKSNTDTMSTTRTNTISKHSAQPFYKSYQGSHDSSSTNHLDISTKKNIKSSVLPAKLLEGVKKTIKGNISRVAKQVLALEVECGKSVLEASVELEKPLSERCGSNFVCSEDVKDVRSETSMVITENEDSFNDGEACEMSPKWCLPFGDAELETDDEVFDVSVLFSDRFDKEYKRSMQKAAKKKNKKEKHRIKDREDKKGKAFNSHDWKPRNPPPNYFVAVQVANTQIQERLAAVQKTVLETNKDLHPIMNPIPTVHLTMMVMRLDSDDEMYRACLAMDKCGDILKSRYETRESLELNICGLGTFKNQVVFAKVTPGQALEELENIAVSVNETMKERAILPSDNKGFKPHITIMKMSRANFNFKKTVAKCIDPDLYKDFQMTDFGLQEVSSLQLCAMMKRKSASGYYHIEHEVMFGPNHNRTLNENTFSERELHEQSKKIVDFSLKAAVEQLKSRETIQGDVKQDKQESRETIPPVKNLKPEPKETIHTPSHLPENGDERTDDAVDDKKIIIKVCSEQKTAKIETLGDTIVKSCMDEAMNEVKNLKIDTLVDDESNPRETERDDSSANMQCDNDRLDEKTLQDFSRNIVQSAIESAVLQVKEQDGRDKKPLEQDKKKNTKDR